MEDLLKLAIEKALEEGASFADARIVSKRREGIHVKNGGVERLEEEETKGLGIRVIWKGALGFASTNLLSNEGVKKAAEKAMEMARGSHKVGNMQVELSEEEPGEGKFVFPYKVNPWDVPLSNKVDFLLECERALNVSEKIRIREAFAESREEEKFYASSEGAYIEQIYRVCGAGISATAIEGGESQMRSYPLMGGNYGQEGWEFVERLDLASHAERIAKEAEALLSAPYCPSDERTLILGKSMLALQIHESCGHPSEGDRVFGYESSYAGDTFLTLDKKGNFRYGSPLVNIVADATLEHALGHFEYDDEGVKAQRVELVKEGIFSNYLTSREVAKKMGITSGGCARAEDYRNLPLIRMTNINLEPGDFSLEELIRETRKGLMIEEFSSWSIDDKRLNFQFAGEIGYLIENGDIKGIVRNPTYTGITPHFWNSLDAISDEKSLFLVGLPNCGKGEPPQAMTVGHRVPYARFQNVRIGVMKR